jgi:hypothetical protein
MDTAIWGQLPMELVRYVQDYLLPPRYELLYRDLCNCGSRRDFTIICLGTTKKVIHEMITHYGMHITDKHRLRKSELLFEAFLWTKG